MINLNSFAIVLLTVLTISLPGCTAGVDEVAVVKKPMTVEERVDEGRVALLLGRTPLPTDAVGVTEWVFHCQPQLGYDIAWQNKDSQRTHLSIRVTHVEMKLSLSVKVNFQAKIRPLTRKHEYGHVAICRKIFQSYSDQLARQSAMSVVGKLFPGEGNDYASALQAAIASASESVCLEYRQKTAKMANALSAKYDQISDHGHTRVLSADEAVQRAFEQIDR